jgi:RimJ/RimL family protein N-acetyltransferase
MARDVPTLATPTLVTQRLTLRAHRAADFPACAAMWADPAVTRFIGGRPFSAEEVWGRLLRYAGLWSWLGFGYWAIAETASGRFLGEVGFADFKRDLKPPLDAPELGWALAVEAHGRGYATEAVRAVLAWSDQRFARAFCIIQPDNHPSHRVAAKCGFHELRRATYKDHTTIVLARDARET